ncbi:hypothetical protein EYC80_004374 [Monilinia laxa]|uniref:Uncharacterized protein n=1 Tax=Monilinia laxa TaxID=61186 RepID=A0A5N6KMN5_MONLA|nr:hypothetical protein EYC80_004374 [Monilinia laxa]
MTSIREEVGRHQSYIYLSTHSRRERAEANKPAKLFFLIVSIAFRFLRFHLQYQDLLTVFLLRSYCLYTIVESNQKTPKST